MRDGILQMATLLLLALLIGGGSLAVKGTARQVDFVKLQADVEAAAEVSGLNQENAQLLRRFYGLNGGELVHWILYTAQDNMSVEELLLV